jgi:hypothetical protein
LAFATWLLLAAGCSGAGTAPGTSRLFNGKDLAGWQVLDDGYYRSAGKVTVRDGQLVLAAGEPFTGVRWAGEFPEDNYQLAFDAMRVEGDDFFCGLTLPVGGGHATLILGGWRGSTVGLSNVDGLAANDNQTTKIVEFQNKRWYHVEVLVAGGRVEVAIDREKVISLDTAGKEFAVWMQLEDTCPLGITTYYTTAALKDITLRGVRSGPVRTSPGS